MSLFNYECDEVKRKIEEVSPNYPQLTTYEKEWLYFHKYGYIPGIPVELEYETVSVNPTGSVSNAIPFNYKSAILKGNTKYRDIDTGDILDTVDETKNLELVSVKVPVLTTSNEDGTKTNILTVNEEVELRGIMDVRDELNLLTGELTQCVGEIILNGSEDWTLSSLENSRTFYTTLNNLVHKKDYLNSISCDKFVVHTDEFTLNTSISPNGISGYVDKTDTYPNENWLYIKHTDSESSVEKFKQWLSQNPITVQYQLTTESVKTVALTPLNNPYEGTNHYELTSNIPCEAILEVPVVSTGKQTLVEINN